MIAAPYRTLARLLKNPRRGWVGMDIHGDSLHLAQVERTGNHYKLVSAWTATDTYAPPDPPREIEEMQQDQDSRRATEGMIQQTKEVRSLFSQNTIAMTFGAGTIDYRELEVDIKESSNLDQAIQIELERELGDELSYRLVKAWELPIQRKSQQHKQSAAVASVAQDFSMWLGEKVTEAGYVPEVLDALPCALARAAQMFLTESNQSCLVVHIANNSTTLTQVHNGQPSISRVLNEYGFEQVLSPLSVEFGISPSDVNCIVITASQQSPDAPTQSSELREIIHEYQIRFVQSLANEIYRTLEYIRTEQFEDEPTGIILCGAGSVLPDVSRQFEQLLELPTETWSIPLGPDVCLAFPISLYAVAAGLSAIAWEQS